MADARRCWDRPPLALALENGLEDPGRLGVALAPPSLKWPTGLASCGVAGTGRAGGAALRAKLGRRPMPPPPPPPPPPALFVPGVAGVPLPVGYRGSGSCRDGGRDFVRRPARNEHMNGDKKVAAHTDTFNGREPTTGRVFVHSRQVRTAAGHAANGGQLRQRRPPLTCGGRFVTAVAAGRQTARRGRLTQRHLTLGAGIDVLRRRRSKRRAARARGRIHHHHRALAGMSLLFTTCGYACGGASDTVSAGSVAMEAQAPSGKRAPCARGLELARATINTTH